MMLEIVEPPVTYLEIIRAALIPALLYYLSLLLIVHFNARREAVVPTGSPAHVEGKSGPSTPFEGTIFATALGSLILFLILGYTAFRAVTLSLVTIVITSSFHSSTRLEVGKTLRGLVKASRDVVPLVAAAACVGIIIGIVTLTGIGTRLPATIIPLAEQSLFLALVLNHDLVDHFRDGAPVGGVLSADGDAHRAGPRQPRSHPPRRSFVHLLLRDDVDGHATGGAGRLRGVVHRRHEHHAHGVRGLPVRHRRFHIAVHVRLPAGTSDALGRWQHGQLDRDASASRDGNSSGWPASLPGSQDSCVIRWGLVCVSPC